MLEKIEESHNHIHKEAEISIASMLTHNEKCRKAYLSHWQSFISHLRSLQHTVQFPFLHYTQLTSVLTINLFLFELVLLSLLYLQMGTKTWLQAEGKRCKRKEQSLMQVHWKLSWNRISLIFSSILKLSSTFPKILEW